MSNQHGSLDNKSAIRERILAIASGGICIAVAQALSMIKIFRMPQGGSVTPASMLPIIFFGLCFGAGPGFAVAVVYSMLQLLIDGLVVHPVQVALVYILAFS